VMRVACHCKGATLATRKDAAGRMRRPFEPLRTRIDAPPLSPGIIDSGSPLQPGHFVATCATGKRLKVPLSAKPIMVRAPTSMQIIITRLLRSLILGNA
jgi:hypothetical protein